ncbi:hypothetical protein [Allosphingosinicella deserti]|uniref:Uncharacterized protein n=1 Tax=Allosphingosinicella deserti TaxID=2116704 RepID=A0A2P7QFR6_9SPHN|nr:hypothetical protein [Sphingomonas deserti]PSJ36822.1 hypothetical protein C7I55_24215 [Sphingomonas deserti]
MNGAHLLGAVLGLAGLALPASAAESPFRPVPGSAWSQDPATGCRFVRPASLTEGPTHWAGACRSGKADGLGMLRRRDGGASSAAFYGELRDGVPAIGVLDLADGYVVGRFVNGDIGTRDTEWQERLDSFRVAARAARAVSARYAAQKNPRSAAFYKRVAETLDMQIE